MKAEDGREAAKRGRNHGRVAEEAEEPYLGMEEEAYLEAKTVSMLWPSASSWDMVDVSTIMAKLAKMAKMAECGDDLLGWVWGDGGRRCWERDDRRR